MYQDTFQRLKSKMFLLTNGGMIFLIIQALSNYNISIVKSPYSYLLKIQTECVAIALLYIVSYIKTCSNIHKFRGYFYVNQINPKVDLWQQKLLMKLQQQKKGDKLMDLHSKSVEVIELTVILFKIILIYLLDTSREIEISRERLPQVYVSCTYA